MESVNLHQLLELASTTARKAGAHLREVSNKVVNDDEGKDIKLQADVDAEILIREELSKHTGFPLLGEEIGGNPELLDSDSLYWVIDPVDGTYNYFRDQDFACVSIGLMQGREFLVGAIYELERDMLYAGGLSIPSTANGELITPRWSPSLEQGCIMTGFPGSFDFSNVSLQQFVRKAQVFKKVRMLGSATMQMMYVATGRADVYFEEGVRLWDIAAGAAILQGVGGDLVFEILEQDTFKISFIGVGLPKWIPEIKDHFFLETPNNLS